MTHDGRTRRSRRQGLVPALPRPAWVVLAGGFVSAVGSGLTLPFLFIYADRVRGLTDGVAGLVVATLVRRDTQQTTGPTHHAVLTAKAPWVDVLPLRRGGDWPDTVA